VERFLEWELGLCEDLGALTTTRALLDLLESIKLIFWKVTERFTVIELLLDERLSDWHWLTHQAGWLAGMRAADRVSYYRLFCNLQKLRRIDVAKCD